MRMLEGKIFKVVSCCNPHKAFCYDSVVMTVWSFTGTWTWHTDYDL